MTNFHFGRRATVLPNVAVILMLFCAARSLATEPIGASATNPLSSEKSCHSQVLQPKGPARTKEHEWVKGRVRINAPLSTVWYSVHEERKNDPDLAYSKVLEQSENAVTLEQKFVLLPMLGSSVCVMRTTEVPLQRIDYHLLKSDRFKAMEGSWILTANPNGKSTVLELNSHVDLGVPVPHWFVNATLARKIDRRLNHVKLMAEKMHAGVVAVSHSHKEQISIIK